MATSRSVKRWILPGLGLLTTVALVLEWQNLRGLAATVGRRSAARTPTPIGALASSGPGPVRAEGRLVTYPGAEVSVASEVAGTLARVAVVEQSRVRRGELLAELRSEEQRAALAEARAQERLAEVDVRFLEKELRRAERLQSSSAIAVQALDRARHELERARARLHLATATTRRLVVALSRTRVLAPIDGVVTARFAQAGETIGPGTRLVTIADLSRTRVEAEVDEFDALRVRPGASVRISVEGLDGQAFAGRVEEIPDAVSGRRLKPQDPGRPADTRVLLVKVALLGKTPLKLGQRVELELTEAARIAR
ncbi:MAG: efflux RND transporter periplasmic adaptor subunit [Deltaproteobacteria bacterium]|nr:efflux RND transporter periplasmic adaptor subunit [Deltaproteobacteria bacterium]